MLCRLYVVQHIFEHPRVGRDLLGVPPTADEVRLLLQCRVDQMADLQPAELPLTLVCVQQVAGKKPRSRPQLKLRGAARHGNHLVAACRRGARHRAPNEPPSTQY